MDDRERLLNEEWARYRMYRARRIYNGLRPVGLVIIGVAGLAVLLSGNLFASEAAAQNSPLGKEGATALFAALCALAILGGLFWISRIIRDITNARKAFEEWKQQSYILETEGKSPTANNQ